MTRLSAACYDDAREQCEKMVRKKLFFGYFWSPTDSAASWRWWWWLVGSIAIRSSWRRKCSAAAAIRLAVLTIVTHRVPLGPGSNCNFSGRIFCSSSKMFDWMQQSLTAWHKTSGTGADGPLYPATTGTNYKSLWVIYARNYTRNVIYAVVV